QRQWADIAVRFAPVAGHEGTPLSAEILLRPTIAHPDLCHVLTDDDRRTVHLKLIRDSGGRPVDALHVHGHAPRETGGTGERAMWKRLSSRGGRVVPGPRGQSARGTRREALATAQLLLLGPLLEAGGCPAENDEGYFSGHERPVPAAAPGDR